jgi:dephospho-CoA kinase
MNHHTDTQTSKSHKRPPCIGLTGGIGSGKSLVSGEFGRLGATIIDTDRIARELVAPGQAALDEIIERFGNEILTTSGSLDRARLRKKIFNNATDRYTLEEILHPRIRAVATARADACSTPYSMLVIPLLAENAHDYPLDRILVIDCPEQLQRQRVAERDHLDPAEIDAILAAQASRSARLAIADDIIANDGDPASLKDAVARLHRRYLALSSDTTANKWA